MTSSDPLEGPEHHTGTLSPVSPKPVHVPSPANIPILENQMDTTLNDESLPSPAQPVPDAAAAQMSSTVNDATNPDKPATGNGQDSNGHAEHSAHAVMYGALQQAPEAASPATEEFLHNSTPQGALDHGALPPKTAEPVPAPGADVSMPSAMSLGGFNIQELLDNISASASSSAAPQGDSSSLVTAQLVPNNALVAPENAYTGGQNGDQSTNNGHAFNAASQSHLNFERAAGQAAYSVHDPSQNRPPSQAQTEAQQNNTLQYLQPGLQPVQNLTPSLSTTPATAAPTQTATADTTTPHPHNIDAKDGESVPWDKDTQRKYDSFLDDERQHVLEGRWDRFPNGSRLFIGNLSSEKVTKRDLFHVFHRYGKLAQISIKQAYGFVQFMLAEDCARALHNEQGVSVRGRKVHLEISKRQNPKTSGDKKDDGARQGRNRRSRSPERNRNGDRHRRGGRGRQQDNYRPSRSPTPPRARGHGDQFRSRRSPDRYDGRRRSRSPPMRDGRGSPSMDDGLPIPRRAFLQVPDVQILSRDLRHQDGYYVDLVKGAFQQRGFTIQELSIDRLDEAAVVRRQIFEGVVAVLRISPETQRRSKYHLSIFARQSGAQSVRFEDYQDMDLNVCIELVARAKQQAKQPDYGLARFGVPSVPPSVPQLFPGNGAAPSPGTFGLGQPPNMAKAGMPGGLDPAALQRLLQGGMGNVQSGPAPIAGQVTPQLPSVGPPFSANDHGLGQPSPHGQAPRSFGFGQPAASASSSAGAANGADIQSIIAQLGQYRQ